MTLWCIHVNCEITGWRFLTNKNPRWLSVALKSRSQSLNDPSIKDIMLMHQCILKVPPWSYITDPKMQGGCLSLNDIPIEDLLAMHHCLYFERGLEWLQIYYSVTIIQDGHMTLTSRSRSLIKNVIELIKPQIYTKQEVCIVPGYWVCAVFANWLMITFVATNLGKIYADLLWVKC